MNEDTKLQTELTQGDWSHSRLPALSLFHTSRMTFYSSFTETMHLLCIVLSYLPIVANFS